MAKKTKEAEGEKNNLDELLLTLQEKFGEGAIMKLGDKPKTGIDAIPTGSIGLDHALGIGGLPRGRIIEIFGPESSGKTTLALHVVAEAQKLNGLCAYIDAEHAMDPEYAKKLGVKIDELLISQGLFEQKYIVDLDKLFEKKEIKEYVLDKLEAMKEAFHPFLILEGKIDFINI